VSGTEKDEVRRRGEILDEHIATVEMGEVTAAARKAGVSVSEEVGVER
jgi:hypothetical protein